MMLDGTFKISSFVPQKIESHRGLDWHESE